MDGDDLLLLGEQRLVDGDEVADRGLGRRSGLAAGAKPLVEVVVVGDLRLSLLDPADADVEADEVRVVTLGQRRWEVGSGVGNDGRIGAHAPRLYHAYHSRHDQDACDGWDGVRRIASGPRAGRPRRRP